MKRNQEARRKWKRQHLKQNNQKPYNKCLINLVCSLSTGKYLLSVFSHRPRSFVARSVRKPQALNILKLNFVAYFRWGKRLKPRTHICQNNREIIRSFFQNHEKTLLRHCTCKIIAGVSQTPVGQKLCGSSSRQAYSFTVHATRLTSFSISLCFRFPCSSAIRASFAFKAWDFSSKA